MRDVSFGLYLRDDQVIVCPSSWGIDIDPVMIVPPVETEVQQAIEQAIELSGRTPSQPEYDPKKWPVLKALRLKSARAFHKNVVHIVVLIHEGKIQVLRNEPTKRGQAFVGVGGPIPVPDIASLGAIALQALQDSPRMNPRPP